MGVGEFPVNFFKWFPPSGIKLPGIAISLPLAVLAVAFVVFINETSYQTTVKAVTAMEQAQNTRSALNDLMQSMLDAETGPPDCFSRRQAVGEELDARHIFTLALQGFDVPGRGHGCVEKPQRRRQQ